MEDLWVPYEGMEDLVFTGCYGRPITRGYLRKNLDLIVKRIDEKGLVLAKEEGREAFILKKITPHTLRHIFATRVFEKGMKPKAVQEILGHSSLSMTMDLYTHVTEDIKESEMKKLEIQA